MERTTVINHFRSHYCIAFGLLCSLAISLPAVAEETFRLNLLDGKTLEGTIVSVSQKQLEFKSSSGTEQFLADQIKSLQRVETAADSATTRKLPPTVVQLRDATILRTNSIELAGKNVTLQLAEAAATLPAADVQWIRFRETVAANEPAWQEILAATSKSDRLVVIRAGDSLDTIEGLVQGIDANEVRFNFDGDEIKAPKAKLLGMTFFSTNKKSYPPAKIKVTTVQGDSIAAIEVEKTSANGAKSLRIVTAGDISLNLPWNVIEKLDFSAGNLQLAAELLPLSTVSNLDANYPGNLEIAKKLFAPHADRYGTGGTSSTVPKTDLLFQGSGAITYRVPDGMSRFQTTIAGNPTASLRGWSTIIVQQEEEILFQQSFRPEVENLSIDIPVVAKRQLTLKTSPENPRQTEDTIWWLQPRFVK
jgi:hypothetical protein